ncbi:MAG: peptidoglycan editing factor PgeF [Caldimicrobium sp.]
MIYQPELFKKFGIKGFFSKKIPKNEVKFLFPEVYFPKQIHSDKILFIEEDPSFEPGDAVITLAKNLTVGVQTADCLPILIADKKRKIAGAVHAGWRGTFSEILKKTLEKIFSIGFKPEDILIAIGPHIQASCYEVKEDLIECLPSFFKKPPFFQKNGQTFLLNLSLINLYQAKKLGIPEKNIWISPECTHCLKEKYHSYRREKNHNFTQISLITLNNV